MSQLALSHLKSAAVFVRNSNPSVVLKIEPEGIRVECSALDSEKRLLESSEIVDWNRIEMSTGDNQVIQAAIRAQQNVKEVLK